ncbi:uncharacterized protein LOC109703883, partial [Ananas comosus]|uniref:Uncharacterized protein LOC109703883 n=1 Tax=Ananas comosus TaxID=4615 RepID=A0A6P5EEW2_ANACO
MARVTDFAFNPPPSLPPTTPAPHRAKPAVSRSSFFVRFPKKPIREGRVFPATKVAVVARYGGGGGGYRPGGGYGESRRPQGDARVADPDYDPALDLDRVKSSTVRLLDEQQNMIGVVSKNEAIRMANDADLILAILSVDADPPVLRLFDDMDY